jgi:glycerophosphoryl diester phosphodiesterase
MRGKKLAVGGWQLAVKTKTLSRRPSLPTVNRQLPTFPLIIGHRGAAALAPENTLVSFERALKDGADGIEFDVRLAEDNVPVVIHDATLSRTGRRKGRVASLSSAELSEVDVGTWFNLRHPGLASPDYARATIPTLARVFEAMIEKQALLYVELKCGAQDRSGLAAEVVKLVRSSALAPRVVVESFDLAAIAEIKRLDSGIRTAALFDRKLSHPVPSARRLIERASHSGAEEIALHRSLAVKRTVERARQNKLETVVWTVDNPAWVQRALKSGVRAIITNNPARLCARRAELLDGGR